MNPIALITDFGLADHFVGSMKAAIFTVNPQAAIIDISHDIPPGDIAAAAFMLLMCSKDFPKSTIFVVVVDPGVGSERSPIAIKSESCYFVGPDNGVLSLVGKKSAFRQEIRRLENNRFFRNPVCSTFHGRDIFGPVAGHLSKGLTFTKIGPLLKKIIECPLTPVKEQSGHVTGNVIAIDRFGNCITAITTSHLKKMSKENTFVLLKGKKRVPLCSRYCDVLNGKPLGIFGSAGFLEISINNGNAARKLRLKHGDPVEIRDEASTSR
jgi:S-adenosyl-L-methionine hydrolase (adenosine-forming)